MTSVTDILQEREGKWMKSADLVSTIAEKLGKSERQAYRLVAKSVKNKEIRKVILPDRSSLFGLPEWPIQTLYETSPGQRIDFKPNELLALSLMYDIPVYSGGRAWKKFADTYVWLKRGAKPEEKPKQ